MVVTIALTKCINGIKITYHCGASLNHAGNKTFAINKLEDISIVNLLIYKINEIVENNLVLIK